MSTVTVDRTVQRFTSFAQPEPDVAVQHTTEVMAWPPYAGGGQAPHATIWPLPGVGIKVREHIPFTQYAKALMNLPGGVETNRRGVIQFELIGTCDPKHRGDPKWFFWPDADDVVLKALADYQRPILTRFGIPFAGPAFQAYSASYGPRGKTNTVRMSNAQWNAFQGICGHQHVPENTHGDPGAFPIARFIAFLKGTTPTTEKDWFDMATAADLRAAVKAELNDPAFLKQVARYVAEGYPFGPEGEKFVLAAHVGQIKALAGAALTQEQLDEALQDAVQIDVTVSAKENP